MRSLFLFAVACCALILSAPFAHSTTFDLSSSIDGAQANTGAGSGSPGTGSASITLDDATNLLSWSGDFSGLLGDYLISHFHGPAAPGVNAGVALGFAVTLDSGNRSGTFAGSATISPAQVSDVLAGLWYINIHTVFNTAGEIRGQVVPEPTTAILLGLGMLGLGMGRSRARIA